MSPASQPARQRNTDVVQRDERDSHVEHGWQGVHRPHTPGLLPALQSDPPFPTLHTLVLATGAGAMAFGRWKMERERSLLIWEAGGESRRRPGPGSGARVGLRFRLGRAPGSADTGPFQADSAPPAGCSWRIQTGNRAARRPQPGQLQGQPWSLWEDDKRPSVPGESTQPRAVIRSDRAQHSNPPRA